MPFTNVLFVSGLSPLFLHLFFCFCFCFFFGNRRDFIAPGILIAAAAKLLQSCPTLCDPIDGSPRGSPIPGILQARTLQWVAISFSNC